jgi:hypothetical protein
MECSTELGVAAIYGTKINSDLLGVIRITIWKKSRS